MSKEIRKKEYKEICDKILKVASSFSDRSLIILAGGKSALTRFGENEITQNVSEDKYSADVLLIKEKKVTKVQVDDFREENLKKIFQNAVQIMKFSENRNDIPEFPSECIIHENESANNQSNKDITPDDRAEIVKDIIEECEKKDLISSGIMSNENFCLALSFSNGLFLYHENLRAEVSATAMDEKGYSGWIEVSAENIEKLNIAKNKEKLVNKALLSKNPDSVEVGNYDVILEPAAVADLLLFLSYIGFSTVKYYEGDSPFSEKLGQKVMSEKINIQDNAWNKLNPGIPFDLEGMARKRLDIIKDGVLNDLPYDINTALKHGKKSTGHGFSYPNTVGPICTNLELHPGNRSMDEIIKDSDNCLLVTHFHYTNIINPNDLTITGMTRDGFYQIKDGKISNSLHNMRFTQSIIEALNNVIEVSSEQVFTKGFFGGGFICPALKIKDFRFSSKTDY